MQMTKIIDMKPFMTDVNSTFIVLERLQPNQGATTQYLVADETAAIHLHIWEKDFSNMTAAAAATMSNTASGSTQQSSPNPQQQQQQQQQQQAGDKGKKGEGPVILNPGDICRVINGRCTIFKSSLGLYIGKGTLERIGEFCMIFNESKNMSLIEFNTQQASGGGGQQAGGSGAGGHLDKQQHAIQQQRI